MKPPIVTIILTSYNKPFLIAEVIESVLAQTVHEWELLIMDDNSDIQTVTNIQKYLNDSRISYFNSNIKDEYRILTVRYATLINLALEKAQGEYITYLTDDTIYVEKRLEIMLNHFKACPFKKIVYSSQLVKKVNINNSVVHQFERKADRILDNASFNVDHCSVMHHKDLLINVKGKYGDFWDDDPEHWNHGDAMFWGRLSEFEKFFPINEILDVTFKTPYSFQSMNQSLPYKIIDGTIIKGAGTKLFYIQNQTRKLISNEMFTFFKFDNKDIVQVSDPVLFSYPKSTPLDLNHLPNYILVYNSKYKKYYYLEDGKKRALSSMKILNQLKFNIFNAVYMNDEILGMLEDGPGIDEINNVNFIPPSRKIFKTGEQYWIFQGGVISPISKNVLVRFHLEKNPINVSKSIIKRYNLGSPIIETGY